MLAPTEFFLDSNEMCCAPLMNVCENIVPLTLSYLFVFIGKTSYGQCHSKDLCIPICYVATHTCVLGE